MFPSPIHTTLFSLLLCPYFSEIKCNLLQIRFTCSSKNIMQPTIQNQNVFTSVKLYCQVHLLDIREQCLQKPHEALSLDDQEQIEVAGNAARALWSLSQSNHNKADMQRVGIIGLLPKLLKAKHPDIVIQTMGMLQNCGNLVSHFE